MRHYRQQPDFGRNLVFFFLGAWSVLVLQCLL
jgi:hypothetical protein